MLGHILFLLSVGYFNIQVLYSRRKDKNFLSVKCKLIGGKAFNFSNIYLERIISTRIYISVVTLLDAGLLPICS